MDACVISEDESDDEIDFSVPLDCELPPFLDTDFKWNECVKRTRTLHDYCSLIGQITNHNMTKDNKIRIMMIITSDITITHRYLSPYWRVLQQHAYFSGRNIL